MIGPDRKYVALSIKHTEYHWKFGMACMLWGWHQTDDDEKRCFGGYTQYLNKAERYSMEEFLKKYGEDIIYREPVHMSPDLCKRWKDYDTVLVDAEEYRLYCTVSGLAVDPPPERN